VTIRIRGRHFDAFNVGIVVALLVWLGFQIFVPLAERPPSLDQAFMLVLGGWVTNKAMEQRRKDDKISTRVDDLTEAVAESNIRATASELRADVSEVRANEAEQRQQGIEGVQP
jgi:outer membrane murein-binding lipoprotein Lpp